MAGYSGLISVAVTEKLRSLIDISSARKWYRKSATAINAQGVINPTATMMFDATKRPMRLKHNNKPHINVGDSTRTRDGLKRQERKQ